MSILQGFFYLYYLSLDKICRNLSIDDDQETFIAMLMNVLNVELDPALKDYQETKQQMI